jgi:hypothetical protein
MEFVIFEDNAGDYHREIVRTDGALRHGLPGKNSGSARS